MVEKTSVSPVNACCDNIQSLGGAPANYSATMTFAPIDTTQRRLSSLARRLAISWFYPDREVCTFYSRPVNLISRFGRVRIQMHAATSADGVRISYEAHGTGIPALVFVHGWSCDRGYWKWQLTHFAQRYQVAALDLAGHGESGTGRNAWTMQAFGEDVVAVVEKLRMKDVVLIGHSMGGNVIVEATRLVPNRIRGLVWVDTYQTLGKSLSDREVREFLAPFHADFVEATRRFVRKMFIPSSNESVVDWVVPDMSAAPPEIALKTAELAITFDREILEGLRELKAPVVAINSDRRPTDVEALQRYGIEVVLMSRVGHFLMMEDSDNFNRLLAKVIEGFSKPSAV